MVKNRTSLYNTIDYWNNNLAPKYFDMSSVDTSRVGLYGYLNEIMADTTGDVINENSVLFNEIFFKKAQIPESILAYAAQYRIEEINAVPAKMGFYIGIREDMILDNCITDGNNNSYFIIDDDTEIFVEDEFKYMLDFPIRINIRKSSQSSYIYSAQYLMDKENKLSDIKTPYLKVTKQNINNSSYIFIIVTARQIEKTIQEHNIFNEDMLSYIIQEYKYDGVLADFNVYYRAPKSEEFVQLKKLIIDSAPVDEDFCYYQYVDDNTLSISFSTLSRNFRPEFNSTIRLEIFTTQGIKGNFSYSGNNVRVNLKSEKYDYKKVIAVGDSVTDSSMGQDRLTYEELKNLVSYYASTANNISTALDLDKYFSKLESNSKLTFVKKRDDILDRLFGAFMLMKDSNDTIIPSNTLDIHIGKNQFDQADENVKRYVITSGNKFVYTDDGHEAKRVEEFKPTDTFRYSNPYTIVLNKQPLSVSYYLNSIDKTFTTEFKYINIDAFYQFITNNVKIERDAINGDNRYKISFRLVPNLSDIPIDFAELDQQGNFIRQNDMIKVFGEYTNKEKDSIFYNEFKMTKYDKQSKEMTFETYIETDDYISATNKLRIKNSLYENGTLIPEILIEATEMIFNLLIFYKEGDTPNHGYEASIPSTVGYQLTNSYTMNESVNLINDMTDIMRSTVVVNLLDEETKDYEYLIRNVPLTNYEYIHNRTLAKEFINNIFVNAKNIRDSLKLITNNFAIDYKLYNTYGKSRYFYILGDKTNTLDNVNLSISMGISLSITSSMDATLQYDIIEFIKNYIEETNEDNNFYVSNLISDLETRFSDIKYITFNNINKYDYSVQSVEKNFPSYDVNQKGNMVNFVPEFINVAKDYSSNTTSADYNIDIQFK